MKDVMKEDTYKSEPDLLSLKSSICKNKTNFQVFIIIINIVVVVVVVVSLLLLLKTYIEYRFAS